MPKTIQEGRLMAQQVKKLVANSEDLSSVSKNQLPQVVSDLHMFLVSPVHMCLCILNKRTKNNKR